MNRQEPFTKTYRLEDRAQTASWGKRLGGLLQSGDLIALVGDLGAGKTTLTKAIGAGMGISDSITSPTFTLVQEYYGKVPLFHFDPYRLKDPEEMFGLGFDEYFERHGVIIIEWADKISELLPPERLTLELEIVSDAEPDTEDMPRSLRITAFGERYIALAEAILSFP